MRASSDTIGACWRLLRRDPLQLGPWSALASQYAARGLAWQAAYAGRQARRLDAFAGPGAGALPGRSPGASPDDQALARRDEGPGDVLLGRAELAQAAPLIERFLEAVAEDPGDWLSWLYLARLREIAPDAAGAQAQAEAEVTKAAGAPDPRLHPLLHQAQAHAVALEPIAGESLHRIGSWRLDAGDPAGAIQALSQLLDIRPIRHGSMMVLGEALLGAGQVTAAGKAFARAALSDNPAFLVTLADKVLRHNGRGAALELLHKALTLLYNAYALADCRAVLARIRALDPHAAALSAFEAGLAERLGDAGAFLAVQRAQCQVSGDPLAPYACGLPMTALYDDTLTAAEVAALHRSTCARLAVPAARSTNSFANPRTPGRRLRVGWVGGDLRDGHPVELFMRPLLARLDPAHVGSVVYDVGNDCGGADRANDIDRAHRDEDDRNGGKLDGQPRGPAQAAPGGLRWVDAGALDDAALRQAIVDDGIDILVDLSGHTASRRLGLFAGRAAPVQATFLGYPHSTGLAAIDWLIGDAVVSPAEHAALFSEGIAQLPGSVFCWSPPLPFPLPAPRAAGAPLVFGSFNNAMKISPRTVALWSAVLHAVPDAQLLLKAPSLGEPAVQARYLGLFRAHGIAPGRLLLRGPSELAPMMQEYGDIDIALDPAPYNGGTTTLQALWMGVPVVTLAGANFVGRMGASFMQSLGQPDWVARDDAGYVAVAVALARDRGAVRTGRARLRERMQTCALGDIDAYAGHVQACLRAMWVVYCSDDHRRLLAPVDIAALAAQAT